MCSRDVFAAALWCLRPSTHVAACSIGPGEEKMAQLLRRNEGREGVTFLTQESKIHCFTRSGSLAVSLPFGHPGKRGRKKSFVKKNLGRVHDEV